MVRRQAEIRGVVEQKTEKRLGRVAPAHELGDAWYFDYAFENVRGLPASEWEGFGGAPGFIVPKDGAAPRDLSWEEYSDHELGKRAPDKTR